MPLPQHIRYGEGGTIHYDGESLPSAATVRIVDGDGSTVMSDQSANISTINTTLKLGASRKDKKIVVNSNVGMSVGCTFWIRDDPEDVIVERVIDGTSGEVLLRRPLLHDHASAASVQGGRVTFAVNSAVANSLWWDGHAAWNIDSATYYTSLECTKYGLDAKPSYQDLADVEPKLADVFSDEVDMERHRDAAMQYVLMMIAKAAPSMRTRVFVGSQEFRTATALAAMYLHYRRRVEGQEIAERFKKDLQDELEAIVGVVPRDADQDGAIEADERMSMRTVELRRG